MTLVHTADEALAKFKLIHGAGDGKQTACAMTALSWMRGIAWTDAMECAHPILRSNVIKANDAPDTTQDQRAALVRAGERGVIDTWWVPTTVIAWALGQYPRDAGKSAYDRTLKAVETVAAWKDDKQRPDLRGADLVGADLRAADLRGADLRGADLVGAYLRDADLRDADLRAADLRDADLRDADLRDADLRDANLRGANLRGAYLRDADLRGARYSQSEKPEPTTPADRAAEALRLSVLDAANINTWRHGDDATWIEQARSLLSALAADVQALTAEVERLSEEVMGYQCGREYEQGWEHGSMVAVKYRDERDTAAAVAAQYMAGRAPWWTFPEAQGFEGQWIGNGARPMTDSEQAYILGHREGQA